MDEQQINNERNLVLAAQKDLAEFNILYDKYFSPIFSFVYRRTDNEALAEDLTSQTFLKAINNLPKYKFQGLPFSAWLYRIASNEVSTFYRKKKKKMVFSIEEQGVLLLLEDFDDDSDKENKLEFVVTQLNLLPLEEMEVLELKFFEDKTFKEIAYIVGISESAAKMRTYRTLEKIKSKFGETRINDQ